MNILELETVTIKWAMDRGIITNGKATTQVIKLTSEFGELCYNLHNGKDCKDDIGDMMVVITNITQLLGFTNGISECPPRGNEDQFGILRVGDYLGRLADNIIKGETEKARTNIGNLVFQLMDLAERVGTNLEECWNKAYNDIKDRRGFLTPEGNFIKESDPAYKKYVGNQLTNGLDEDHYITSLEFNKSKLLKGYSINVLRSDKSITVLKFSGDLDTDKIREIFYGKTLKGLISYLKTIGEVS